MAKSFEISNYDLSALAAVVGSVSPQEISKSFPEKAVEAVNRVQKTHAELDAALEPYREVSAKYREAAKPTLARVQAALDAIKADGGTDEERKAKGDPIVAEANAELEKLSEEVGEKAAREAKVTVTVQSNDRFDLLKQLFEKVACEKYLSGKALSAAWEALEGAKEA